MGGLDVDSLFTNILLEETITISTESIYNENDTVEGLSKSEFKKRLSLATKESLKRVLFSMSHCINK